MASLAAVVGGPKTNPNKVSIAFLRALRTLLQGVAGAFPAAGAGTVVLTATYWETFGYSLIAAGVTALVSLIQNIAAILPEDA